MSLMTTTSSQVYQAVCSALLGQEESVSWHALSSSDWMEFAFTAQAERVAPLLYHGFRQRGWPAYVPDSVRQLLAKEFYNAVANSTRMFAELERVLSKLEESGIATILLKGAALAVTVYSDLALRPMADIDLLIPLSNLRKAVDTVEAMAYEPENPPMRRGLEQLFFYEINFRGGERCLVHLELHWDLVGGAGSRYRPNMNWFWEQTRRIRLGSASALILSPTAHFLHAAVHVSLKHGGDDMRLLWLFDLHLMITSCQDLDWSQLISKSIEFHWAPAIRSVLSELYQMFATPIPAWVLETLASEEDAVTESLVQRLASPDRTRTSGAWNHLAFLTWPARLQWLAAVIFPDPAYMRWRYRPKPSWLWPVCYAVRWADMGSDFLMAISRRLFH